MMSRRFTRLTTDFSKKREAFKATVAVFVASYNLCWRHSALRMSPAMPAGRTREVWTVRDLLTA